MRALSIFKPIVCNVPFGSLCVTSVPNNLSNAHGHWAQQAGWNRPSVLGRTADCPGLASLLFEASVIDQTVKPRAGYFDSQSVRAGLRAWRAGPARSRLVLRRVPACAHDHQARRWVEPRGDAQGYRAVCERQLDIAAERQVAHARGLQQQLEPPEGTAPRAGWNGSGGYQLRQDVHLSQLLAVGQCRLRGELQVVLWRTRRLLHVGRARYERHRAAALSLDDDEQRGPARCAGGAAARHELPQHPGQQHGRA